MTNERIRCINMGDNRASDNNGTKRVGRVAHGLARVLAASGLALTLGEMVTAEPVKFDWRYQAGQDDSSSVEFSAEPLPEEAPNPVVLPTPEPEQEHDDDNTSGWHWISPKIAGSPGMESNREAVRLANREQQAAMAERHSPLNAVLPGSLSGMAPMAVETGIEYRF